MVSGRLLRDLRTFAAVRKLELAQPENVWGIALPKRASCEILCTKCAGVCSFAEVQTFEWRIVDPNGLRLIVRDIQSLVSYEARLILVFRPVVFWFCFVPSQRFHRYAPATDSSSRERAASRPAGTRCWTNWSGISTGDLHEKRVAGIAWKHHIKGNISKIEELIDSEFTRPRQDREVGPDSRALQVASPSPALLPFHYADHRSTSRRPGSASQSGCRFSSISFFLTLGASSALQRPASN
jgi:hypothetical protein